MTNDEFLDDEDNFEDLESVDNWADGAVLWSTDWTVETVLSQLDKGNIDLNPSFQRRSAWNQNKQSLFIESLILGLPIPQLILAEDPVKKRRYIVIDGKQRLLAIKQFATENENIEVDADTEFKPLKLKKLKERADLNGKMYKDLLENDELDDDLTALQNSTIRTVIIKNWKKEAYLWQVFLRINTGSVQLSPQELRQALHPGNFSNFIDFASGESEELKLALNLTKPDFRMRDAELLLRYISYKNNTAIYSGNLKDFLDKTTKRFNVQWEEKKDFLQNQVAEMEEAFKFTRDAFGESDYLRKWNGDKFESRKNRAVFDIMLHFFSDPDIRNKLIGRGEELKKAFCDLCENDQKFLGALEKTTKAKEACDVRFNKWGSAIGKIGEIDIPRVEFGQPN